MAALEALRPQFEAINTQILAINPASVTSHISYCSKKGFNFPILADPDGVTVAKYETEKSPGKGVQRSVYLIDPEGKIRYVETGMGDNDQIMDIIKSAS